MWQKREDTSDADLRDFKRLNSKKARFLVDENLGKEVSILLNSYGYNTVYVDDVGLTGHSDEDVFSHAWENKRFILTHDRDYLDNAKFPFHRNYGVIVLPGWDGSDNPLRAALAKILIIFAPYAKIHVGVKIEITVGSTDHSQVWKIRRQCGEKRVKLERNGRVLNWAENDNH